MKLEQGISSLKLKGGIRDDERNILNTGCRFSARKQKKYGCGFEGVRIGDGHEKMVILIQMREASFRIRDLVGRVRDTWYRRVIVKEDLGEMQWKAFCLNRILIRWLFYVSLRWSYNFLVYCFSTKVQLRRS